MWCLSDSCRSRTCSDILGTPHGLAFLIITCSWPLIILMSNGKASKLNTLGIIEPVIVVKCRKKRLETPKQGMKQGNYSGGRWEGCLP